jgi:DNA repair protein RadC
LSDAELLAILIGSGNNEESAVDLCKRILKSVESNLVELSKLDVKSLSKFKGIGEAKALSIVAALELGRGAGLPKHCKNQASARQQGCIRNCAGFNRRFSIMNNSGF